MKYCSTRNKNNVVTAAQAIAQGLASDGGLYLPVSMPAVGQGTLAEMCKMDYRQRAAAIMGEYLDEFTHEELEGIVNAAYSSNFDCSEIAPVKALDDTTALLELWHGPTCAFKDMALQMLPHLLTESLKKIGEKRKVCILVATSGDTGKAALEGFADVADTAIAVFYPQNGVSDVQKLQMVTQRGENVYVCAVEGNFDDAQTGVKRIFSDSEMAKTLDGKGYFLSSANSINWGRLLPQIVYYFSAYCDSVNSGRIKLGEVLDFCVPTGNFGDILAGWYAKKMGLPVGRLICASNSNNVLSDFIATGVYDRNRRFYTTASPSMDILVSSNLERLLFEHSDDASVRKWMEDLRVSGRYEVGEVVREAIAGDFAGGYCDDADALAEIKRVFDKHGYLMDTHTAVAARVLRDIREREGAARQTVIVSTASPFKFCGSVLDALGQYGTKPGTELIKTLTEVSGVSAPASLATLDREATRFFDCVPKDAMADAVLRFLSEQ